MRVLTSPAKTGAVTLALPQDVQSEAFDYPEEMFDKRVWHIARPEAERALLAKAADWIRSARKPLIVAGGGCSTATQPKHWRDSPRRPAFRSAKRRPVRVRFRSIIRRTWEPLA